MNRLFTVLTVLTLAFASFASAQTTHFFDRTPYRVHLIDETSLRELSDLRLDVDRVSVADGVLAVEVFLNPDEVKLLEALGYRVAAIPDEGYEGFLREKQRLATKSPTDTTRDYHTYETLVAELQAIAAANPTLCHLYNIGPTVQGRALWFMKISDNVDVEEDELEFRYIAAMHGNEVVGKEMCIYLINYLVDNYGVDPAVTNLVNDTEIWILPSMNPDGTAAGSRYNANGVDLNRDFPDRVIDSVNTTAGRQIETADVMNWNFVHQPIFSANFHGGALVANYPWDGCYDPQANHAYTDDQDVFLSAAETYSSNNLPMWNNNTPPFVHGTVNGVDWYQINGGLQDWSYVWMGDMDITMEISNAYWPSASQLPTFWNDNRPAMIAYMQFAHRGVRGVVTDASTGAPLLAQIMVQGRDDFTAYADSGVGDYHRPLQPGTYNIDVTSFGYWPAHLTNVQVQQGPPTRLDVQLQPADLMNFAGTLHNPVGGGLSARLTLLNAPYNPVQTNASGEFSFSNVYEGEYILRVEGLSDGAIIQFPITLSTGMPDLQLWGPVALLYDGFEAGLGSWTAQGTWGTSGNAYAGSLSASDSPSGNYGSNLNISLTNNSQFDLTDYDYVALSYRIKFNYETNYDSLFAEVSTNGSTWNRVNFHNSKQDGWSLEVKDLSSYAGMPALRVRYRLWTDGSVTRDGGFIDEVRICAASTSPTGQTVTVALTPYGTPIQIPSSGGSFNYNIAASNGGTVPVSGDVWCDVTLPSGSQYGPTLGPVIVNLAAGGSLNRDRTQQVPGGAPAGTYAYHAYIGDYPATIWDQDSFTFVKLGTDASATGEWLNWGEEFPGAMPAKAPLPEEYILAQNFPNPFNPVTQIHFAMPENGHVSLKVYNAAGQLVQTLLDGYRQAGWHEVTWDASDLATGLYVYSLEAGSQTLSQKAILVK